MTSDVRGFVVITHPVETIIPIEITGDGTIRTAPTMGARPSSVVWDEARTVTLAQLIGEAIEEGHIRHAAALGLP